MIQFLLCLAIIFSSATTVAEGLQLGSENAVGENIEWLVLDNKDTSRGSDDPDDYHCFALRVECAHVIALPVFFHHLASLTPRPRKQSSIRAPPAIEN